MADNLRWVATLPGYVLRREAAQLGLASINDLLRPEHKAALERVIAQNKNRKA